MITKYYYESFVRYGYKYNDNFISNDNISIENLIGKKIAICKYKFSKDVVDFTISGIIDTGLDTSKYQELYNYNQKDASDNLNNDKYLFNYYQKCSIHSVGYVSSLGLKEFYDINDEEGQGYNYIIGVMPNQKSKIKQIINYLNTEGDSDYIYKMINTSDRWIKDINTLMSAYKDIGGIAGLVLMFFSILLLASFINLSINSKIKEMGIIRSLGGKSIDVFKIFSFESISISLICFILSTIGTIVGVNVINDYLKSTNHIKADLYTNSILSIFFILFIDLISCIVAVFYPILKVSKKTPVDIINN